MIKWLIPISALVLFYFYYSSSENTPIEHERNLTNEISNKNKINNKSDLTGKVITINDLKQENRNVANEKTQVSSKLSLKKNRMKSQGSNEIELNFFPYDEMIINGLPYKISPNLIAVPRSKLSDEEAIANSGGFRIIKTHLSEDELNENRDVRVLYNPSTKRMSILTGKIVLNTKNFISDTSLKNQYSVEVIERISHLNLMIVQIVDGHSIFDVEAALLASKEFQKVEVEIIEGSIYEK